MTTSPVMGITDELLAELEEAAKAATPGPWSWDGTVWMYDPEDEAPWLIAAASGNPVLRGEIDGSEQNALFIALSNPATVLALIARIRELEAREVVLPIQPAMSMYASADECRAALDAHNRCQAAIEEAGVRVEP